jgi:hypothetical protein
MAWRPINVSQSATSHLPPLLISSSFRADSYTVQLTDLTHLWIESLDERSILRRSGQENTSIDPSDGDQLGIFLEKIKLGVDGDENTTLTLAVNADADRPSITLNITVPLPGGLAPLEWHVHLKAASQAELTTELTIPLLQAQEVRMQEIASLAEVVREKDHVIQKLVDKLEAQGTDLGQVFPQAAGKGGRKVGRKQAEEKVKGLGLFLMEAWRKGMRGGELRDVAELVGRVFASEGSQDVRMRSILNESKLSDRWWDKLKENTFDLSWNSARYKTPSKPTLNAQETTQDDFQVQATPPRQPSAAPEATTSRSTVGDSTDDDDDDLDAPSQRSKIFDSFPSSLPSAKQSPKSVKKIGGVVGKKEARKPPPSVEEDTTDEEPSPPPKPSKNVVSKKQASKLPSNSPADDDTTADDEPPQPSPAKKSKTPQKGPASPAPTPKSKNKLGIVGGKKFENKPEPEREPEETPNLSQAKLKETAKSKGKLGLVGGRKKQPPEPAPASVPEPDREEEITLPRTAKKKLGQVGGGKTLKEERDSHSEIPDKEEGNTRGRQIKVVKEPTPEPPRRETSEERADRKREALKRELEEKAKAPVKKKRRF